MNSNVKLTTRFMKGKMLMFVKTSIGSFVYDMIDVFCFLKDNQKLEAIYDKMRKKNGFRTKI